MVSYRWKKKKKMKYLEHFTFQLGASLVVQWLRIHLAVQGTLVRSLVQEDPTWLWSKSAHTPELLSPRTAATEAGVPRARVPQQEKPPRREAHTPQGRVAPPSQLEKARAQPEDEVNK